MKKLRIGVIGTGNMGRNHVRILATEDVFDLVGIYDCNEEISRKLSSKFGVRCFGSERELLEQVEAVVIAVPSFLHKRIALLAAELGVHALVEKPIATNTEDAKEIINVFEEKCLKLAVGHVERFNPVFNELKKVLMSKDIIFVDVNRYSPFSGSGRIEDVGIVEDLMIHDVDLVCDLFSGQKLKRVFGMGEFVRTGFLDIATCMIEFENGYATISASRVSQHKERIMTVHTEDGCYRADLLHKTLEISKNTNMKVDVDDDISFVQESSVQKVYIPIEEPLKSELKSFYRSVVDDEPIEVTGGMGLEALKICETVVDNSMRGEKE